ATVTTFIPASRALAERGDDFTRTFEIQNARDEYEKAFEADSSNCTALWKMAEAYVDLGEEVEKKLKPQYFYTAEKWARRALAQCPQEPNSHFFVAVTSGKLALFDGGRQKVRRSVEVKQEAEKTLALDPNHHGAYHILGRWHREISNLSWIQKAFAKVVYGGVPPGASNEAAVANFKRAIDINPLWINHYRQLGLTYLKMKKWRLAAEAFEKVLELPEIDHSDKWHKQECARLLEEVKSKIE
ncbi:MAG: tetratricopeptide repeat protein, partial [bacterium]